MYPSCYNPQPNFSPNRVLAVLHPVINALKEKRNTGNKHILKAPKYDPRKSYEAPQKMMKKSPNEHISFQFSKAKCWEHFQDASLLVSQDQ